MKSKTKATVISLLSTIGFFGIFSTTISKNPVLPLFMKSMQAGTDVIGTIAAISPLAGIVFSFPVGLLADRLGKKRLLVVAAFVFLLAPLCYLLVVNPWWLIPIRFFHGIATAILGPVSAALILGEYKENKGQMLGIYSSATLVGRTLAPILGGAVISLFAAFSGGWNFRLVYVVAFLLALPVFVLSFLMPGDKSPESGVKKVTLRDFGSSLAAFVTNGRLLGTALVEMATYFTYGAFETYLPLYLQSKGLPPYQIGLIFSLQILAIALTKPFFGGLSDRIDRRVQILVGILVLGGSFALIPVVSGIAAATAIGIVFGIGLSFSTVATSTYVSDVTAQESLGASMGALSSIMDIGQSAGPFIIGAVIQASTMTSGFFVDFGVCLVCAAIFAVLNFSTRKRSLGDSR
ncbi:MAG: MFS transporter [Spirochaetes bacterium]|nr:MFS transporter [Spirochaetota bacterium]